MKKKLKVKRKLVYKLTHRYECEIVKFYTHTHYGKNYLVEDQCI